MSRSIFLLMATIIGVCFACAQAPTPLSISQPLDKKILTCDFVSKIQVLQQFYNPQNNSYSPPTSNIQQNYRLRQEILDDLSAAFANAPQRIKDDLCALDGVFIDSNSCVNGEVNNCRNVTNAFPISWGYRSTHNTDLANTL